MGPLSCIFADLRAQSGKVWLNSYSQGSADPQSDQPEGSGKKENDQTNPANSQPSSLAFD